MMSRDLRVHIQHCARAYPGFGLLHNTHTSVFGRRKQP
jgi:hypothetical protein